MTNSYTPKYKIGDLLYFEIAQCYSIIDNITMFPIGEVEYQMYIFSYPMYWGIAEAIDNDSNIRLANKVERLLYGK